MRKQHSLLSNRGSEEDSLLNLTPLIDVVFIVLIAFMLMAPLLEIDSIALAPSGEAHSKPASQNHPISITLRADNTLWFQGKEIPFSALEKTLLHAKTQFPNAIPQIIPDARSHFETYQKVKNSCEACGFETLDIVLKPQGG